MFMCHEFLPLGGTVLNIIKKYKQYSSIQYFMSIVSILYQILRKLW